MLRVERLEGRQAVAVTGRGSMGHQVVTAIAYCPFVSDPLKR